MIEKTDLMYHRKFSNPLILILCQFVGVELVESTMCKARGILSWKLENSCIRFLCIRMSSQNRLELWVAALKREMKQ